MKLSAVISTFNNESLIQECLESLTFADEIVVVDHNSSDNTATIARKFTKRVYSEKNDPLNIDIQKNSGFEKAKGDWILSIDSDERITPELADEIRQTIESVHEYVAYKIPRKNMIFGKWIEHSIWWPDYKVRLFQKGKGRYAVSQVHKELEVDGQIGQLTQSFIHENYQTVSQYLQKMDLYTENEAKVLMEKNTHFFWLDAIRMPFRDFLKTFFLQEGYKDGFHGLVLSILQGFYMFLVVTKVWEKQGFTQENPADFLSQLRNEWRNLGNEASYWFFSSFIIMTKNPITKMKYKILRKRTV